MRKPHDDGPDFFIVGIGASAGGLEALEVFFKAMPADCGLAFIVVVHLDPSHVSLLPELIQRRTTLTVAQITDNLLVKPNTIYLIPPNKTLTISQKCLQLRELELPRAHHLPIDNFLCSLAQDQHDKAIAVILSGTGSDGSLGLREIKAEAGLVIVQDPHSAKYDGMPKSAVDTGLVDYVLAPQEMPAKLVQYSQYPQLDISALSKQDLTEVVLLKILSVIRNQVGQDFSLYKRNTLYRRIERRMQLHQIEKITDYWDFFQNNAQEIKILAKEFLIGVASFFRDPEAFDVLKSKILPALLAQKHNNYTLRVWIPGCSTGEEAYSIAIILQECLGEFEQHINVQIFGTDIDETTIDIARRGFYPASISNTVNQDRLKRFFNKEEGGFAIKKSIREMMVFAVQNITKDPPFTKLDLISCRNLLIYFSAELQKKVLPLFQYGLKEQGVLFLGSSETIGQPTGLFTLLDKKWKIYSRTALDIRPLYSLSIQDSLGKSNPDANPPSSVIQKAEETSTLQLVEAILRRSSTPPCAIIDAQENILYVHGKLGNYLEPAEGRITVNIVDMIHPALKAELISALRKTKYSQASIQKKPCTIPTSGGPISVSISVCPIPEHASMPGLVMVVFEETPHSALPGQKKLKLVSPVSGNITLVALQKELDLARETLQTTIEELEAANEEFKSSNEELQSTNEELQSTNEELETSK